MRIAGILAIWHDITPGYSLEFEKWHSIEHLAERVSVPGFVSGRRFMSIDGSEPECFTLYEANHIKVFGSVEYLSRLNSPSDWTVKVQPNLTNFDRAAASVVLHLGAGHGGFVVTVQVPESSADNAEMQRLVLELYELSSVVAVTLAKSSPSISELPTAERALRGQQNDTESAWIVLVEMFTTVDVAEVYEVLRGKFGSAEAAKTAVYRLSHTVMA